jgi:hypothetical protein
MKKRIIILAAVCFFGFLKAQDNVGIGTLTPNAKSILDLTSNNKGFLAPRMTTAERIAIAPAASEEALMVFDTDLKVYFYWDGTQWIEFPAANGLNISLTFDSTTNILSLTDAGGTLTSSLQPIVNGYNSAINNAVTNLTNLINNASGNDWSLTGNAGTNVTTNYIGTSDAIGLSIRTNATERIRITAQTGFVGIGIAPGYPLDVLNQVRFTRSGTSLGVANESHLELFNGTTGDVYISFHKAGIWGAHFGLDATNWFSTNGWSAGAGFTSMRVGNIQANGGAQVTNLAGAGDAPVFTDAAGNLFRGAGVNAPVQIYSFTFATQNSSSPVPVQEFSTGIPVASYDCVLADYSTSYDIDEQSRKRRKSWLYNNGGTWVWSVDYGVHSNNNPNITNTDVKVLCFSRSSSNWNGNVRERNINY